MGVLDDYEEISTMTDATMTPDAIELALAKLAPDAQTGYKDYLPLLL